jgi:hypothetical protein
MEGSGRRGVALLAVLGALAVLALLAVAFTTLAATDALVSQNALDAARARLLADAGVEAAVARLRGLLERGELPGEPAAPSPGRRRLRIEGQEVEVEGPSGPGTYARNGDLYVVRVRDANGQIHVNDGLAWGPDHAVSRNLRRILNVLGAQPSVRVPGLGDRILAARPASGYVHKADLLRALDGDAEAFRRVRDFLTVRAWSDPDVVHPIPLSAEAVRSSGSPVSYGRPSGGGRPLYRYGHQKNYRGDAVPGPLLFFDPGRPDPAHNAIWGRDSLNPQWIEVVSRSPVHVNAAPREVLLALLTDLEGVFLVERRRAAPGPIRGAGASPCRSPGGAYDWTALRYTYDGSGEEGDECGFLYRTVPFAGPGGRHREGISAEKVVEEILACRERRASPGIPGLHYAQAPFGGPFRTWAQFHLFVDELVRAGLIADRRESFFWDYGPRGERIFGPPAQLRLASQAAGDVLKANFNPNLHLNELNPDRPLFAHVDKTDLVVHSTEFCLTPMGYFEIESTGLVLRPRDGSDDALTASDNERVARATVTVQVRLFDALRQTTQGQFARGELAPRRRGPETNNNRAIEIGPEPDNGPAPLENRYEGYLQLPTLGSNLLGAAVKPPGALWTTLSDPSFYPGAQPQAPGGPHLGSVIHAHFQLDHAAHHHAGRDGDPDRAPWDGFRLPQGAWQTVFGRRCCLNRNWEDRTEEFPGPYSPVEGARAGRSRDHRLARSFRPPPPEGVEEVAPSDLRIDGAYVERGSAFGYWIDESESFNFNEGTAAFWFKPAFFPEAAGKRRTLLSASRYHAHAPEFMNPSPFALFLTPSRPEAEDRPPLYTGGVDRFRPASLLFGFGFSTHTGYNWELLGRQGPEAHATGHAFVSTPRLAADDSDARAGLLRAHSWVHIAVTWSIPRRRRLDADSARIYVNGRLLPGSAGMAHPYGDPTEGQPFERTPRWTTHSLQAIVPGSAGPKWCKNTIRLGGEPSVLVELPRDSGLFPGNYTADGTFDEFYLWMDRSPAFGGGLWGALTLWARGRYYRPDDADPEDARFVSAPIDLGAVSRRRPPPPSGSAQARESPPPGRRKRLLAVAWTEWAEDYDRAGGVRMRPRMYDHAQDPPAELRPESGADVNGRSVASMADLFVELDGSWRGPFRDPAWSPVRGTGGRPPSIADPGRVRYAVKLKAGAGASTGAVLLASPVVDDVTLYFDEEEPEFLSWTREP